LEQNKIWEYYQTKDISSFDGSYARLKFLLGKCRNKRVLNIGVGGGVFEKLALKSNVDVYSIDPSAKSIDMLHNMIGKEKAKVGYSQDIPFSDNFFDVVIMSEVLEHLETDIIKKTLKEVKRVLKEDGKFIGTVPYNENLKEQIVICPTCGEKFHRWGHVQSFDIQILKNLLSENFSNVKIYKKMFISWNVLNWKGKISAIINYIIFRLNFKKSGLNLYFEAMLK